MKMRGPFPKTLYVLGLDLGQAQDPSALAVVERLTLPIPENGERDMATISERECEYLFHIRHLERVPLRTDYTQVAAYVQSVLSRSPLCRPAFKDHLGTKFVMDFTGLGAPVFDIFTSIGLRPTGITLTSGESFRHSPRGYNVSKLELISSLQGLLHSGHLMIAEALEDAKELVRELESFRVNWSTAGNPTFSAKTGAHDDLVIAVGLAVWLAKNHGGFSRRTFSI
jgi:hypothetical protein